MRGIRLCYSLLLSKPKLFADYRVSSAEVQQPAPLSPSPTTDEAVKVDVRRLALLQRESCV